MYADEARTLAELKAGTPKKLLKLIKKEALMGCRELSIDSDNISEAEVTALRALGYNVTEVYGYTTIAW